MTIAMTKSLAVAQVEASSAAEAAPPDRYAGQGGSYVMDPETGVRTLVERTEDNLQAPPVPADEE